MGGFVPILQMKKLRLRGSDILSNAIQRAESGSVQFNCLVTSDSLWLPGFLVHHQLPELAQTYVHQVGDAIWASHPLSSSSPPAFSLSQHQVLFQWVSSSHQVARVLELQPQHQSFQWIVRTDLIRIDWLDLLAVQRILKNLLQHHSSKALILQHSAFFIVQLSHPYLTTGKTIALSRLTFVGKVMSLLFNMLSRLVIAFLPRSKCLLIYGCSHHLQWFWSPPK